MVMVSALPPTLLESMECIIDMLEDGEPVDIFYLDFCKAFDSVLHYRLLA